MMNNDHDDDDDYNDNNYNLCLQIFHLYIVILCRKNYRHQ